MNRTLVSLAERLIAGVALMLSMAPALAASVDVNIGFPGIVVEQRPVYVQPQYENDWRERQVRARQWRDNPINHGHMVNTAAPGRKMDKKHKHEKHRGKNKHGH